MSPLLASPCANARSGQRPVSLPRGAPAWYAPMGLGFGVRVRNRVRVRVRVRVRGRGRCASVVRTMRRMMHGQQRSACRMAWVRGRGRVRVTFRVKVKFRVYVWVQIVCRMAFLARHSRRGQLGRVRGRDRVRVRVRVMDTVTLALATLTLI